MCVGPSCAMAWTLWIAGEAHRCLILRIRRWLKRGQLGLKGKRWDNVKEDCWTCWDSAGKERAHRYMSLGTCAILQERGQMTPQKVEWLAGLPLPPQTQRWNARDCRAISPLIPETEATSWVPKGRNTWRSEKDTAAAPHRWEATTSHGRECGAVTPVGSELRA